MTVWNGLWLGKIWRGGMWSLTVYTSPDSYLISDDGITRLTGDLASDKMMGD